MSSHTAEDPNRRDFIVIAAQAFAAVGAAVALWPFIHQMNPDASTQALATTEVDLSPVKPGQATAATPPTAAAAAAMWMKSRRLGSPPGLCVAVSAT